MKSEKRILISFVLNFMFTIFELIGGLITNSIALLSDSVHDLGDSISMGIAIILEKKSKKKPDFDYTYGYYRFSLLGALISAIILLLGSTIIIIEAVKRLFNPEAINAELVIYFAIAGVIINGIAALNISKGKSLNEKVISLHLFEDLIGWVVLLIAAIVMKFADINILDAILSIAFTLYIIYHVYKNLNKIFHVLLEKAPKGFNIKTIIDKLSESPNVIEVHHVHLWSLEGSIPLITLHAKLNEDLTSTEISETQNLLRKILKAEGIGHATIQIEFDNTICIDDDCVNQEIKKDRHHGHHH